MSTDSASAYMLNESAVKLLGWSNEEAIGKKFNNLTDGANGLQVIGIIKDYHHKSLKEEIDPIIFSIIPGLGRYLSLKVSTENLNGTIRFIEEKWNEIAPGLDFDYFFVDENFDSLYRSEEKLFALVEYFAFLAIFISCLGLFALTSYTTEQKTKEIGIRKALGAKVSELTVFLLKPSFNMVIIASILAMPVVLIVLNFWLRNFAFKIEIDVWWYLVLILFLLAFSTAAIAYQTVKAARANPVKSLRYE
jgi:putative ABC transport system permease protein